MERNCRSGYQPDAGNLAGVKRKMKMKSAGARAGVLKELVEFLWERKLWWLIPLVVLLVTFGMLMVFAQASGIAPFIYTLF